MRPLQTFCLKNCFVSNLSMEETEKKEVFAVTGMACAACALSVESMIGSLPGVTKASVNYAGANVFVSYDPNKTNPSEFVNAVESIGYGLLIEEENLQSKLDDIENKLFSELKKKLIIAALFSVPVFVLSMFHIFHFDYKNWLLLALSIPVIVYSGSGFYETAWKQARHRMVNMDTLVALSTGIAFIFSLINTVFPQLFLNQGIEPHVYYESATVIITFILAGKFMEERAKSKASSAIRYLMGLQPKTLTLLRDGEEMELSLGMVAPGDIVLVRPGDRIPVDGNVNSGESYVDESMITGEPIPVLKNKDIEVFAGTLNKNGSLTIIAGKAGKNTLLAGIIALVQEAQSAKPPIQKLADKIASVFVPVVLFISLVTFLAWWFLGPPPSSTLAFLTTISVLIIACPCALGLATPTALIVGIGRGASRGMIIRNATTLETACKIDTVVFDKTGTLTYGNPVVANSNWYHESELLRQILYTIEKNSTHPLAGAIVQYLGYQKTLDLTHFEDIAGKGVKAQFENMEYLVGNKTFMQEHSVKFDLDFADDRLIYFAENDVVKATFLIDDKLRSDAKDAVAKLKKQGIEVYLLTGDAESAASRMAAEAGITNYAARILPAGKNDFITELKAKGRVVAMVGDGINDSAALAKADLGIAMANGSDIAIETAGIILIHSDLLAVSKVITLSKATVKIIRQNFFWAFIYNIFAIPIAAGVLYTSTGFLLNPMIAGAAMAMSSVTVVTNSLRLRSVKL